MKVKKTKSLKNVLVMDLGSSEIKCIVGNYAGPNKIKINKSFLIPLEKEIYDNGRILNGDSLKNSVVMALKDEKVNGKDVILTIGTTEFIERELSVPQVDVEDLTELITYEMGQYLPIDISAYDIQYKISGREIDNKIEVIVGAMPKDIVEQWIEFLEVINMRPLALDVHTNTIEKTIPYIKGVRGQETAIAFIDFGFQMIGVSIYEANQFKFNRMINYGTSTLFQYLQQEYQLTEDQINEKLDQIQADVLIEVAESSSQMVNMETQVPEKEYDTITKEIARYFNNGVEEISKVFKFYNSRSADKEIGQLIVYGGISRAFEVDKFLGSRLGIEAIQSIQFNQIDISNRNTDFDSKLYLNAVGALIRK